MIWRSAGKTITIRYKATLDKDAATTIDGNPNTVELEYTNKIGSDGQPAGDSTDKIHDDAIVYTFAVNIVKTAADKNTPCLALNSGLVMKKLLKRPKVQCWAARLA